MDSIAGAITYTLIVLKLINYNIIYRVSYWNLIIIIVINDLCTYYNHKKVESM